MENSRQVIPVFILAAIVAITLLLLKRPEQKQEIPAIAVRTTTLSDELPSKLVQISGTTQSAETALLRFQVSGRVTENAVRLGDVIEKGDLLATLYNPELKPITQSAKDNLARLTAQTNQAERDFTRIDTLYKERAVTKAEWENVQTGLTASKNATSAARTELERATQVAGELKLTAPFAGSVTDILIDVGEVVSAGAPAIRVSNPDTVELKLAVSDTILQQLQVGLPVMINRSLQPSVPPLQGLISEISPYRERGALPEIIISLNPREIGPGVAVNAKLEIKSKRGLSIPMRSVLMTGNNTVAVYRVEEGIANLVPIRPLSITTDNVVIDQGLAAGDALVVEGVSQLYDGAHVLEAGDEVAMDVQSTEAIQ